MRDKRRRRKLIAGIQRSELLVSVPHHMDVFMKIDGDMMVFGSRIRLRSLLPYRTDRQPPKTSTKAEKRRRILSQIDP